MAASFYFTIVDSDGDASTLEFFFPAATAFAVLSAGITAVSALINPLVTGGLRNAGIRIEVDLTATFGSIAQLNSDVQEKAEFAMRTVGNILSRLNLPTFDEAFFNPGTAQVDLSDPDVAAFVDFLETGITAGGGTLAPSDYREDPISAVEKATENWGKRRRTR